MTEEKKIRLSDYEITAIKNCFKKNFKEGDHLWIFGSRVDMSARGGDIDLYVETQETDPHQANKNRANFTVDLWDTIGEQKIDIVLNLILVPYDLVIYKIAKKEGILLI